VSVNILPSRSRTMPQTDEFPSRQLPNVTVAKVEDPIDGRLTHYSLLGVPENATYNDLKNAFRQRALHEHPDKGGDADRFHELQSAYNILEIQSRRDAYDEELRKARDRADLVEGAPSEKAANTSAPRVKTAPTPGSKRAKKVEGQGGSEWKIHGSGGGILKAIEDGATLDAKAQLLFNKYKDLPRNKDKKREWLNGVRGEEKQALKQAAKAHEKAQKAKWDKWLGKA